MLHNSLSPKAQSSNLNPNHGLKLVTPAAKPERYSSLPDLVVIASRRCSSFFAEAAVLVLVFGILDVCILRGTIHAAWVLAALAISVGLLAASVLMDFSAHRWMKAHP